MVRHGESVNNGTNKFTGWDDADLTQIGIDQARQAGRILKEAGYHQFDIAFTSLLKRSVKSLFYLQDELDLHWIPVVRHWRLNEHMYGALQVVKVLNSRLSLKSERERRFIHWNRAGTSRHGLSLFSLNNCRDDGMGTALFPACLNPVNCLGFT